MKLLDNIRNTWRERTEYRRQKIELQKQDLQLKAQLNKSIVALTNPPRSLNDELYADTGGYKTGLWALPVRELRRKSRIAYWETTEGQALVDRWVQIVVGAGFTLQSEPAWEMIPGAPTDPAQREELKRLIELRWKIWSHSKKVHWLEEFKINELVARAFFYYLYDGEYFMIFRYNANGSKNPLRVELLDPDMVEKVDSKPGASIVNGRSVTNEVVEGIEYNYKGVAVAYHVKNPSGTSSQRIPATGTRTGRTNILHKYNKVNERQRRGVPILSGVITELTRISDLKAIELQAAVINSILAIFIKPPVNQDGQPVITGGVGRKTQKQKAMQSASPEGYNYKLDDVNYHTGGIVMDELPAGHEPVSFDTARPNIDVMTFIDTLKKNIYAAKSMSHAVVDYNFSQQYSAARGELIVLYEKVAQYRDDVPAALLSEIYKMWLWGESENQKISLPGYNDEEIRDAWSFALWRGSTRPDIDPKKSADANEIEVKWGWKTNQHVTSERDGGTHSVNVQRLKSENESLVDARRSIVELEKTTYSNNKTKSETVTKEG